MHQAEQRTDETAMWPHMTRGPVTLYPEAECPPSTTFEQVPLCSFARHSDNYLDRPPWRDQLARPAQMLPNSHHNRARGNAHFFIIESDLLG